VNDPSGDRIDAAARYLATGDPTGLPGNGTRHCLDRALALLAKPSTWEHPSPELRATVVGRVLPLDRPAQVDHVGPLNDVEPIDRAERAKHLDRTGPVERTNYAERIDRAEQAGRAEQVDGVDRSDRAAPAGQVEPTNDVGQVGRVGRIEHGGRGEGVERVGEIGTGNWAGRHHMAHGRHRRGSWTVVGAAAAVVLALVGAVAGVVRFSPSDTGGRTELAMVGTDLAPGARAEATRRPTPSGCAVTLRIEELDPAPTGSYYQAWVRGPRGTVPIGTFHLRDVQEGDDEPIALWSGVDPAAYPEITVTLEPEDGDPASSGRTVLRPTS
jgi:hypothetical protein